MAITNYSELVAAVSNWQGDRSTDTDFQTRIPEFITLAETDLNTRADFRLRQMESDTAPATTGNGIFTLPTDYLEWREVRANTSTPTRLEFRPPSTMTEWYGAYNNTATVSGDPTHFTVSGGSIYTYPVNATVIRLMYYAKIPALTATNTTNWLLSLSPNIYLFGSLMYAGIYLQDNELTQRYAELFANAMRGVISQDRGQRYARGAARNAGLTP